MTETPLIHSCHAAPESPRLLLLSPTQWYTVHVRKEDENIPAELAAKNCIQSPLLADLVLFTFILIRFFRTYRVACMQRMETARNHRQPTLKAVTPNNSRWFQPIWTQPNPGKPRRKSTGLHQKPTLWFWRKIGVWFGHFWKIWSKWKCLEVCRTKLWPATITTLGLNHLLCRVSVLGVQPYFLSSSARAASPPPCAKAESSDRQF